MIFDQNGTIKQKEMKNVIKTYYLSTGINVSVINTEGNIILFEGIPNTFCRLYNQLTCRKCDCAKRYLNACKQSIDLGEPYFFFCDLDFIHIAIPLIHQGAFAGGVVVGPIIITTDEISFNTEELLLQFADRPEYQILKNSFQKIQSTDPIRINYLGNMLYMLISREIEQYHKIMTTRRKKMYLQSKMNEQIQSYKKFHDENRQIHELENKLSAKVRAGNASESRSLLNELLARIVYEEGNKIEIIRVRAIEICSLLSRAAIDGGANEKKMLAFNYTLFSDLSKLNNIEELSYWMFKVLDYYLNDVVVIQNGNHSEIIRKAMTYINNHYKEDINIKDVASYVHLNHSYFSTLFKKETGQTFSEYLLKNRIEESKLLLANTDMGILDISLAIGLSSQSYFTKIFKKKTGITPNQYRNQNKIYD